MRRGILAVFKVSSGKKAALSHLSQSDKDTIKKFGNAVYREPTYVDEVFGGVLVSTISCAECRNCSTIHENYLDLSLPVPRDETSRGGEGSHWSRGHRQGKAQKSSEQPVEADIHQRDVGVKRGEEVVEGSKAAPPSKHQMKKAKKKTRKGGKVKQSFQDLQNMLNEADEKRDGGEREGGERGEGGDREGGEMEGGEMDEGEGEKREETKDEGEVGEEGGGEGVRSKAQEPTADEVEPAETSEEP
ncbi:Ubiquitin carboxyl-terminal hydrolase 16, partial [Geodia barretti]